MRLLHYSTCLMIASHHTIESFVSATFDKININKKNDEKKKKLVGKIIASMKNELVNPV